jgi:hypothetical protein
MEGDAMTSGSEPQHFGAQVPAALWETPDAGRTGNGAPVENDADAAPEKPWWFWGTISLIAHSHWPR